MSGYKKSKDISARRRQKMEKGLPWSYIIPVVVLIVVIGGLVYYNAYVVGSTTTTQTTPITIAANTPVTLSDVPQFCDNPSDPSACGYHHHVHLDIFVNATQYVLIPGDLGALSNGSLYAIHTHDSTGIIHLEVPKSAQNTTFTLGQLFEVWGYPNFNSQTCLTYYNQPVAVYVNGTLWTKTLVANVPLNNHDEIAITIGTTHPTIPASYAFPAGY